MCNGSRSAPREFFQIAASPMTPPRIPLRLTCKQASALLIAREDRDLALADRVALKLHLLACEACPKFASQIAVLRAAMRQWRHPGDAAADQKRED